MDTSCSEYYDANWSCSAAYSDNVYALTMCPFKKDKCGEVQKISFDKELNETTEISVKNLTQGDSCAFEIKSNCNSPAFQVTDSFMMDDDSVDIYFIEYEKAFINATTYDINGTGSDGREWTMPSDDKPPRNYSFEDMG